VLDYFVPTTLFAAFLQNIWKSPIYRASQVDYNYPEAYNNRGLQKSPYDQFKEKINTAVEIIWFINFDILQILPSQLGAEGRGFDPRTRVKDWSIDYVLLFFWLSKNLKYYLIISMSFITWCVFR